jgi:hypothetical protein
MPTTTLPQYYGEDLASPGIRQPTGSFHLDAYGLAQAQLTFAVDSDPANLTDVIDTYSLGVDYPDDLGFTMKSYKYHLSSAKGGVSMLTVDYIGVSRGIDYTDAQITGVANTMAQPIETHPNFTAYDARFNAGPLAGTNSDPRNNAIFAPVISPVTGAPTGQYSFGGFGVSNTTTQNKKAGIRQYLRPMVNIRGQILFGFTAVAKAYKLANMSGMLVHDTADLTKLVAPVIPGGSDPYKKALITSVNIEAIGSIESGKHVVKATYDLMIANDTIGWDLDVYQVAPVSIFS